MGLLVGLATGLLSGNKAINQLLVKAGANVILNALGGRSSPFGAVAAGLLGGDVNITSRLLENAGTNALMRLFGGRSSPFGQLVSGLLRSGDTAEFSQRRKRRSRSAELTHRQWLQDNSWRFDWRSQPRVPAGSDAGGEWTEGRLDHPVGTKTLISRNQRRIRTRAMRAYKKRRRDAGQTRTRPIVSSWGTY